MGRHSGASGSLIPGNLINAPDLDDVRESVRQGVTKVAGRLSSLANGVMSTIQVCFFAFLLVFIKRSNS